MRVPAIALILLFVPVSGRTASLTANAGVGLTYLGFVQDATTVRNTSLVAKVAISFQPGGSKFFLSTNVFKTLVVLSQQPSNLDSPDVFGFNLYGGYELISRPGFNFTVAGGWYLIRMLVPGNTYGIDQAMGPQARVSSNIYIGQRRRPLNLYFKFAPLLSTLSSFSLSNHDLSFGFSFPLFYLGASSPLHVALTGDVSFLRLIQSGLTTINATSYTVGIRIGN